MRVEFVLTLLVVGLACSTQAQLHAGDWPQFGRFANFSSYHGVNTPSTSLKEWSFNPHDRVVGTPAVGGGKIFVGSDNGFMYCLDQATGSLLWKYKTGGVVRSSAALAQDMSVVFGSYDGNVYRLDAYGKLVWKTHIGGDVYCPATIAHDGSVLIGSGIGSLFKLRFETGQPLWEFKSHSVMPINSGPAIGNEHPDIVIVRSYDQFIYAVNFTTGHEVWSLDSNGRGGSSAAIVGNVAYIGSWDENLYALDVVTGAIKWKYFCNGEIESHPSYYNGVVYASCEESLSVLALHAETGAVIWKYTNSTQEFNGSPSISNDYVYVGANDHNMHVLHRATGKRAFVFPTVANVFSSAAIADNGMVYFGCNSVTAVTDSNGHDDDTNLGVLYAVNPSLHV